MSPISSFQISVGISTIAGPLRPLRMALKARRSTFGNSTGRVTGSANFDTPRISRTAL